MSGWVSIAIGGGVTFASGVLGLIRLRMKLRYLDRYCARTKDTAAQIAVTEILMRLWSRQIPARQAPEIVPARPTAVAEPDESGPNAA